MSGDGGLAKIAKLFGKEEAVVVLRQAAATEEAGDTEASIKLYRRAFKMWDALDSTLDEGGLPRAVREAAEAAGIDCELMSQTTMDTQPCPRFSLEDTDRWLAHLEEHGYCVLAGVADADAIARAKCLMWDFLESVPGTQVKRSDTSTWGTKGDWIPSQSSGIIGSHGIGQSEFCWHSRLLPGVSQAFSAIWGSEDLITSFDGANVFRPWAQKPEWRTEGGWWHVDQNFSLPGQDKRVSVQGLVTFTDATAATGGLCVIPGSHKHHESVCERSCARKLSKHFVQVQPGDEVLESGGMLVCAKAGDLLLWDSRCVHCNTPGVAQSDAETMESISGFSAELLRVVGYVCMTPTAWASEVVLEKRKQAFINNDTIDHWPHKFHGTEAILPWPLPKVWQHASASQKRLVVGASHLLLADHPSRISCTALRDCSSHVVHNASTPTVALQSASLQQVCSSPMESLQVLDDYLKANSYFGSPAHATEDDYKQYKRLQASEINSHEYPHVQRWHFHISSLIAKFGAFDSWGNPIGS